MSRTSLLERYFAQCQAHRTPPRPEFVASLRDGVMDVNLAEIPLADVRLFAYALLDTTRTGAGAGVGGGGGGPLSARSRTTSSGHPTRRDGASSSTASSQHGPTSAYARTQFVKLHFSHDIHGAGPPSASSLLSPQNEPTLRCLLEAIAVAIRENAATLCSFAWCGMPLSTSAAPGRTPYPQMQQQHRGGYARSAVTIVGALPLCHNLKSLRLDGALVSRAQFMQLTLLSPASTLAGRSSAAQPQRDLAWPALEEASFASCGLTDACRNGLAHLVRAAAAGAAGAVWQRSLRSGGGGLDKRPLPRFSGGRGGSPIARGAVQGLKRLDVSGNQLGSETARALAAAIPGSALRYLNLSNNAVAWEGGAALTAPSVLDDTAMELLDLSSTGVSETLGAAGGGRAVESKLLAESSVAAGFRVVARGMGQLLVLREAARSPQQPWRMQTAPWTPRVDRFGDAPLPAVDMSQEPLRPLSPPPSTQVSVAAPFTLPGPAPTAASSSLAPPPPLSQQSAQYQQPPQQQSCTHPSGSPAAAASPLTPAPTASPYGPWWPLFAQWYAAQGLPPPPAEGHGYVPVPVPFPMFAPMPMPYGAAPPTPVPVAAAAAATTTAAAATPHAAPLTRGENGEATAVPDAAPTGRGADATPSPSPPVPQLHAEERAGGDEQSITHELLRHPLQSASVTTDDDATATTTDSDAALVHKVSAAAGDRQFLLALISRLEAYELGVTERLEAQHQRTTTQLTALEKDVRFRLQQLADAERKERATAADRQAAVLEAVARLREASAADVGAADMTEAMLPQLIRLIEVGMERVQAALGLPEPTQPRTSQRRSRPSLEAASSRGVAASSSGDRDLVAAASKRLKQLGW